MLQHLHVKNLALIEEAEIDFTKGLNILTGETGAGKSLLIGSVQLALGGKVSKDLIRSGAEYGLVELIFDLERPGERQALESLGFDVEEDQVILSRKLTGGKSVNKVNGETVTAAGLREAAAVLLDLHGQHEHQSLLQKRKHLDILDEFSRDSLGPLKEDLNLVYGTYQKVKGTLEDFVLDEKERKKEADFLTYELQEIEEAALRPGEDEELEAVYLRMTHAKKITETLSFVHGETGYDEYTAAGERIGHALKELSQVTDYDSQLQGLMDQLYTLDGLLNDFNRDVSDYLSNMEFGEEAFQQIQERLNTINHLKEKYGRTMEEVLEYGEKTRKRLEELEHYEIRIEELKETLQKAEERTKELCTQISQVRQQRALVLEEKIKAHLIDLNFLGVEFQVHMERLSHFTANGFDDVEFLISTNPGESVKPLAKVASGGELSRIMLAVKTVLADQDDVSTVIFDEIDVGISGRTAQKVSEKMALIGKSRQVICITHLAQIAAMADSHFLIEKQVQDKETRTRVRRLSETESVEELARILGGAQITQTVRESAREMKTLAAGKKC
ncbi:MAG: DNA repair protein RecN [Lachnospiraceae bacterium]|jgi:DNA repair protein RecN (Recombination protein N)|nr:DNA repair protein RecN [Lachnospiraceae bacterium]MCI8994396.1 DNA repair protein RecN [Lachnospiraceae bacterium]MCI9133137.1 DNA repair protein RecN [Lachnospiraceae bacterium]